MEGRPRQVAEERVNQSDKSVLEIGQEVSLLVKTSVSRFTEAFWNIVPLKWHNSVKLFLKISLVTILVVIAFVIGWYAAKNKYNQRESNTETDIDYYDTGHDVARSGTCLVSKEDPTDCSLYYYCENGQFLHKHCPKFHHFDPQKLECVWIHQSTCGNNQDENIDVAPVDGVPTLSQVLAEEDELTSLGDISIMKARLITLPSEEVELVRPGRKANPSNTQLVETIISNSDWEFLFPSRHPSYSYTNFLKAISKFPAVCSETDPTTCRQVLATMFAHFTQETGAHNPSLQEPQWRQGLAHLEEVGCDARDCGYSSTCGTTQWTAVAWPCGRTSGGGYQSYHGRGAKQLSYNYNYGQFSAAMYGDIRYLLDNPELVADTWLNLASAVWFFATPQPPKPSMLGVVEGDWKPNQADLAGGLRTGFGLTTNIINGGIECGKGTETQQARNRVDYYRNFAKYLGVELLGELGCGRMKQFGSAGTSAGAVATYWEQNWTTKYKCKLVTYQTPYSALVQGDYVKCVQEKFKIKLA